MKQLSDIPAFPEPLRGTLETEYGITSAEAFFEHTERNATGMSKALKIPDVELEKLKSLVEGYLPTDFVVGCRQPIKKHARGVIVD